MISIGKLKCTTHTRNTFGHSTCFTYYKQPKRKHAIDRTTSNLDLRFRSQPTWPSYLGPKFGPEITLVASNQPQPTWPSCLRPKYSPEMTLVASNQPQPTWCRCLLLHRGQFWCVICPGSGAHCLGLKYNPEMTLVTSNQYQFTLPYRLGLKIAPQIHLVTSNHSQSTWQCGLRKGAARISLSGIRIVLRLIAAPCHW